MNAKVLVLQVSATRIANRDHISRSQRASFLNYTSHFSRSPGSLQACE
jgi:hypothetical protein